MKIVYIADQKLCTEDAQRPETPVECGVYPDFNESTHVSAKLFQLKEEIEILLNRIEENINLK